MAVFPLLTSVLFRLPTRLALTLQWIKHHDMFIAIPQPVLTNLIFKAVAAKAPIAMDANTPTLIRFEFSLRVGCPQHKANKQSIECRINAGKAIPELWKS